jgi:CheY-like chemotaxis protein/tetratricopeptide (TPR) repeat protein
MSGVSQSLRDGIAAAQARQFERARPLLEQATTEAPSDPVGWFWLAIAAPSAGDAVRCLRRVLELDVTHEQARNGLVTLLQTEAQRLAASGARAEAREFAAEATRLAPGAQSVWLSFAAITDDQKERLEALRKAVAITPDDAQLKTRLRQALLARGVLPSTDRAEARACFKEAAAINPNDPRVWQALAKLADTTAEAVEAFRELVRVAPDQPHGRFALRNALAADARALAEAGRAEDARARWQEIVATSNSDVEAWLGIAATTSNEQEAIQAIETAHRLSPTNEQVIEARARLERSKVDPATVEAPFDAFARFDGPAQAAPSADDPFAQLDSTLDAFTTPAESGAAPAPTPTPTPVATLEAPAAVSSSPDPISDLAAALENAAAAHQAEAAITIDFDSALGSQAPAAPAAEVVLAAPAEPPASDDPFFIPEPNLGDQLLAAQEIAAAGTAQSPAVDPQPQATEQPPAIVLQAAAAPASSQQPPATSQQVPATDQPAVAQAADATAPVAEKPKPASYGSSRKTVMIVDDSPTIRKILGLTLERAGYKVVAEPDGESAIERLVQVVPDVILLDIAMPKIDGYEVCKRIKADPRTKAVPVVMLSGKGALFDKVKGHMAGATEYLTKPFETPAVLAVVANYCEKTAEVVNG